MSFQINKGNLHLIDGYVTKGQYKCRMTCVYEPTTAAARRVLWQELEAIGRGEDLDWIVGGDFNAIAHQDEKFGGLPRHNWEMADFQNFIQESSLIDLGYIGYPFTWNNKRHGRDNVRERLDHFLLVLVGGYIILMVWSSTCNQEVRTIALFSWRHLIMLGDSNSGSSLLDAG